jgi:GNAT superfamily N-acetyltransferase
MGTDIESFTWVPFVGDQQYNASAFNTYVLDITRTEIQLVGLYAVTPSVFETTRPDFLTVYHQESGLPLGEQLYTASGSQGMGIGTYLAERALAGPNSDYDYRGKIMTYYH